MKHEEIALRFVVEGMFEKVAFEMERNLKKAISPGKGVVEESRRNEWSPTNTIPAIMVAGVLKASRALGRRRPDFEAPASARITGVRRSPIEPEEQRLSVQKVPAA